MGDSRDPAIKIFGRTIPLLEEEEVGDDPPSAMETAGEDVDSHKGIPNMEGKDRAVEALKELDQGHQESSSGLNSENEQGIEAFSQDDKVTNPKHEEDHTDAEASGQEKALKKPDKVLPCPRCNSMDTKFCYYNNYNVNQPRHFCKNCQRYWTAGGTMRNVPVGAGRRKNKHSSSHNHPMMVLPDGMTTTRADVPDSTHHPSLPAGIAAPIRPLNVNGTVLKFAPEAPLCGSMASVLNLGDQKKRTRSDSIACPENLEEPSCASSGMASNCARSEISENAVHVEQNQNGMQCHYNGVTPIHPMHCFPGSPWAYPWNPGWNNVAAMAAGGCTPELVHGSESGYPSAVPWSSAQSIAPAFCSPTIPFPFMPAYFWGCMSGWPGGAWNVPWAGCNGVLSPSPSTSNSGCSANGSPTLGKHSRDTGIQGEEKTEKSLWIPKTLRIDDLDEAAKSSIWANLGITPDEGLMYKAFRSKSNLKGQASDSAQLLHANPAAQSRSRSFQESS